MQANNFSILNHPIKGYFIFKKKRMVQIYVYYHIFDKYDIVYTELKYILKRTV